MIDRIGLIEYDWYNRIWNVWQIIQTWSLRKIKMELNQKQNELQKQNETQENETKNETNWNRQHMAYRIESGNIFVGVCVVSWGSVKTQRILQSISRLLPALCRPFPVCACALLAKSRWMDRSMENSQLLAQESLMVQWLLVAWCYFTVVRSDRRWRIDAQRHLACDQLRRHPCRCLRRTGAMPW